VSKDNPDKITLLGEVVETFEQSGKKYAKILFRTGYLEVCVENLSNTNLGDKVKIYAHVSIDKVTDKFIFI